MAAISVTHTFTNGTAADATEVNQNFTDIVNGLSDGTDDITVSAVTANGAATFNGAVTLGNATGDDITITGRIAADVDPKTASTHDLGDATQLWNGVYAMDAFMSLGAVGSPSHSFSADTDTGMYSAGANTLNFTTGGTLALTISDAQLVTAAGAMTVTGTFTAGTCSLDGAVTINEAGADVDFRVEGDTEQNLLFCDASADAVGIGTATPTRNSGADRFLEISGGGSGSASLALTALGSSRWEVFSDGGDDLGFLRNGTNRLLLDGSTGQSTFTSGVSTASDTAMTVKRGTTAASERFIACESSSGIMGWIRRVGSTSDLEFENNSDRRIKDNIRPLTGALDKVLGTMPRVYEQKSDGATAVNFVAQELMEVFPEWVSATDDGQGQELPKDTEAWSIGTGKLPIYNTAAIQELHAQIQDLTKRIEMLQGN